MKLSKTCRDAFKLLRLMASPSRGSAAELYELLSTENNLSENALYLNLGYWKKAGSYDQACQALAGLLAEAARMGAQDEVLDVGFGFADQDFYWLEAFKPKRIVGLNITRSQVEVARRRARERGWTRKIGFCVGSATRMPLAAEKFDLVTALETAFHYDTREDFFREAFRVLKPGGRLALADIIPLVEARGAAYRVADHAARAFWQIPRVNMYPRGIYERKLRQAGFEHIACRSIREQVYAPFARHARARLQDPVVAGRLHPLVRIIWKASVKDEKDYSGLDYVIVTAEKGPGSNEL